MSSKYDKMIVVGFDGLDYKKIKKYECENLMLKSFGKMSTEGLALKTPMLWASIITGEEPENHGIKDMLVFQSEKGRKMNNLVSRVLSKFGRSGLHLKKTLAYYLYEDSMSVPTKRDMEVESVFEKVADSKAFDVPGYNEYPYIAGKMNVAKLTRKYPPVSQERVKRDIDAEHLYRKKQLFENIGEHKLLMQHLHYPDWHQHMFLSEEKDRELYEEMDKLAGEILEKVDDDTLVLFCSDHGLEGGGHRDQAFYATNAEIEGEVKITNLLSKCVEKIDYEQEEEVIEDLSV